MHDWLRQAWGLAGYWKVGRYVVMPDHIHLFCAPGTCPPTAVKKWVEYWKGIIARAAKGYGPLVESGRGGTRPSTPATLGTSHATSAGGTAPSIADTPSLWPDPLWQQDCWDTQLRRSESYGEKWDYVRYNPVRAGLCRALEDWLFQGEMNVLMWHD